MPDVEIAVRFGRKPGENPVAIGSLVEILVDLVVDKVVTGLRGLRRAHGEDGDEINGRRHSMMKAYLESAPKEERS